MHRERLLGALHRDDLGIPAVREASIEELEPGRRLDVRKLQIRDVNQAEQGSARAARGLRGSHAEVITDDVRLARADLDGPVRRGQPARSTAP